MIQAQRETRNRIPPLDAGDRMTRHEFHRRFTMHPEIRKAELIEGVVYVPSPIRFEQHGEQANNMGTWLGVYKARHPNEVRSSNETTVQLDLDNEPMPDLCLLRVGGNASIQDGYIVGPPELVIEISASSASYDLHDKKNAYRRNGVQEYIVWRVFDEAIDWWELRAGEYVPLEPDASGVIESRTFPGLRLDVPAMLADNLAKALAVLETPGA